MRKLDIFRRLLYRANGNCDFYYYGSTVQHKTCNKAIEALPSKPHYVYTKDKKDYYQDTVYIYVAYVADRYGRI
jgi:hypothetical protein